MTFLFQDGAWNAMTVTVQMIRIVDMYFTMFLNPKHVLQNKPRVPFNVKMNVMVITSFHKLFLPKRPYM